MTLKKNGRYWYGTETGDTRAEVERYSRLNGYEAVKFAQAVCACEGQSFRLETDEEAVSQSELARTAARRTLWETALSTPKTPR